MAQIHWITHDANPASGDRLVELLDPACRAELRPTSTQFLQLPLMHRLVAGVHVVERELATPLLTRRPATEVMAP